MDISRQLDEWRQTFTKDRLFCERLFESEAAPVAARLLAYHLWASNFMDFMMKALLDAAREHFTSEYAEPCEASTAYLSRGIQKTIHVIPYLVVHGLISEGDMFLRQGLEHAGILTHLWRCPEKAKLIDSDPRRGAFRKAFTDPATTLEHEKQGELAKRFAQFRVWGPTATKAYKYLSRFSVHGGIGSVLGLEPQPTELSCAFMDRPVPVEVESVEGLLVGVQMLTLEFTLLYADFAEHYGTTSDQANRGAVVLRGCDSFEQEVGQAVLDYLWADDQPEPPLIN